MQITFNFAVLNRRYHFRLAVYALLFSFSVLKETSGLSFKSEPTGSGYYKRRDVVRLVCQVDTPHVEVAWYLNGNALQHSSSSDSSSSNKLLRTSARSSSSYQLRSFSRRDASSVGSSAPNRTVHADFIIERIANGSSLVFAPFRPQANAGEYHCAATDQHSGVTIISKSVLLKRPIGPKQEFEEYMRSVDALSGNNVVLNCTQPVHAEPATYKWRYRKSQILADFEEIDKTELPVGKYVTTPNGNLFLYNVSSLFAGDYRCVTVNELLEREAVTSYYYRLFVRNPKSSRNPVISHFSWFSSTTIEVGNALTLECNADGAPRPTVAWRFSSSSEQQLGGGRPTQYKHKLHTQHEGILTIANASLDDSGIYACELEPAGSEFIKTVQVTVVPPLAVSVFVKDQDSGGNVTSSLHLVVGTSTTLRCVANRALSSSGQMHVTWMKNGVVLSDDAIGVHQEVYASEANLVITNAQLADSGIYQCFLVEEQHAQSSASKSNNLFRSPYIASAVNMDYYHSSAANQQQQPPQFNSPTASSGNTAQPLIYSVHADVFISVSWPVTTLAPAVPTTTTITSSATASKPAEELSTLAADEAALVDAPVVSRVEKQPSSPNNVNIHWDFKAPPTHRDAVSGFVVEYCNITNNQKLAEEASPAICDKWLVGALVNATYRVALVNLMPHYGSGTVTTSVVPDTSAFLFRVAVRFRPPFFASSAGLLFSNMTWPPLLVEPVMPPTDLKAMAIGPDRIAAVWTDSAPLEALFSSVRDKLWYEVQWRQLGSSSGDSANVYEVQYFTLRKPVSSIKSSKSKIVPFVVLADLVPRTFYEIRVRYVRINDAVSHVDPISTWSGIVHAETAASDTPPLLDTYNLPAESLGQAVSALFFPKMFDLSSTPVYIRSSEGIFGSSSELLYTVLGIVMGCLVITLIVFVVLCALRQKRQRKYIQNMRRQLNRLPSKENLNRLLTPSQLQHGNSAQKLRSQYTAPSSQNGTPSHNGTEEMNSAQFNASQQFQQQIGLFTGSALSSPTAVSAAVAAAAGDFSDGILITDARFSNGDRPKFSMVKGNAYGTMSRLTSGSKHLNGSTAGPLQSPHVAHNPYYRTLDNRRMFANGMGQQNKVASATNGKASGAQSQVEQQQPLLPTAESAFVDPPYELPSSIVAAVAQQRLVLANQHALAGLGGPPISATAASSPATTVAQHYSTYSTFGRKNPLTTTISNRLAGSIGNTALYFNDGGCPEGVALADMGVTANAVFLSNGLADMSGRSAPGAPHSAKSSSTSPSATATMQLGSIGFSNTANNAGTTPNGHIRNGSCGAPQSTVSGSIALSDQNAGEDGNSNFNVEVSAPVSNGLSQRYMSGNVNRHNTPNNNVLNGAYRPQLSFFT